MKPFSVLGVGLHLGEGAKYLILNYFVLKVINFANKPVDQFCLSLSGLEYVPEKVQFLDSCEGIAHEKSL